MRALSVLALVLIFAACDSGETGPLPEFGRFEAEISGDVERSLSGNAAFNEPPASEDRTFLLISMTTGLGGGERRSISIADYSGAFEDEGTYRIGQNRIGGDVTLLYADAPDVSSAYAGVSGTVEITRSDNERIEGTFEAQLSAPFGGGGESTIRGSFEAISAPALRP